MKIADGFKGLVKGKSRPKARGVEHQPLSIADLFKQDPAEQRASTHRALPRFQTSATDQLDRQVTDRFSAIRVKLRNAFTPSQPVKDARMFAGRTDVLRGMIRAIEDQKLHLVLYGERGIGKTSLLHMLADAARDARYLVAYSSCGAASTFDETFRVAAQEIPLLFHSGFSPTTSENDAGSSLADLLPASKVTPRQFGDACSKLASTRVLIILDEFDRCESQDFRRELAELIKILSDRSLRVQLVIAGVAADLVELVEHIPSIRRNILAMRVPLMSDEEIRDLVANGETAAGIRFQPEATALVAALAHGSPYSGSLLAHHAGLIALDASRLTVSVDNVSSAVDQALQELRNRIPKQTLAQVNELLKSGAGKLLKVLAGASLSTGNAFELINIDEGVDEPGQIARCRRLAEDLAADHVIIQAQDDSVSRRFSFIEDAVANYIWFMDTQQSFRVKRAAEVEQGRRAAAKAEAQAAAASKAETPAATAPTSAATSAAVAESPPKERAKG